MDNLDRRVTTTLTLPARHIAELDLIAREHDTSRSRIAARAIREYLARHSAGEAQRDE
ncbi:ribbon-helix-helix protein, CopG family [Acidisphaera rubrifaciens]|uniref:Uncharacterized protein n=1 Tax=Acidisphaera rubrifaciens HS-AP3 TaxID=1231350 RepID=A0A0D6PC83_9PROT|nr:ribbon-helix-helix protein, CopG family [Acidisphaera rubrifaciens]GAN78469.1 hypothetical protein Asru_0902_02 [Acidisphaera rubrifaciens HS-AP3]